MSKYKIVKRTCLYNSESLKTHFYTVKLGFTGVYFIFLISAQTHRLWVIVRGEAVLTSTHNLCFEQKFRSRDIGEMAKQNNAKNNAKCSKCFQFLCNNSDRTWFFNTLTFARSLGRCWKPRPSASVFNTSHGTWRMLMHEKQCLIRISFIISPSFWCLGKTVLRNCGNSWA